MSLVKKSMSLAGHRTSISLEAEFWRELERIARERGVALAALVAEIDAGRGDNLASALRLHVLRNLKK